ncbi:unnamed protein product [Didymodactylos carnosus]|uniref:Uncharacterized protein n=1 Tax=Didymodactylos carnosus TaxID=1234261 RepID=A0A814HQ95_9BILA|nr:unnamed protein product [Didymodactylos carnosus]CAF1288000.1 unnamed protein product [Didymodactylos carnosus]CAF3784616.1 unnamed protein product [Didymodactylos carnosus]CAF4092984.1 unnamed protein product [Didymodactylos carnosus]
MSTEESSYAATVDVDDIDENEDNEHEKESDTEAQFEDVQHILNTFGTHITSSSNSAQPSRSLQQNQHLSIEYFDSLRYEIMYEISNVEKQFEQLKNLLYDDSVSLIDRKLQLVQDEQAPEYEHELRKLYDEMQIRSEIAKQRRNIELQALENSSTSELLSLQQTLENDKYILKSGMKEDIERKINELETLKSKTRLCIHILQEMFPQEINIKKHLNSVDGNTKETTMTAITKKRRGGGAGGNTSSTTTIQSNGQAVFYQLSDIDILEDWSVIKKSLWKEEEDVYDDISYSDAKIIRNDFENEGGGRNSSIMSSEDEENSV